MNNFSLKLRTKIFDIVEVAEGGDTSIRKFDIFDIFILILIFLNVIAVALGTVENIYTRWKFFFDFFETFSVVVFTIEYILRIWSCTVNKKFANPIAGRVKFVLTPIALVDLFAILPFYLPVIFHVDLRFIRVLRLFRLFRLLKVGRYFEAFRTFSNVLKAKKEELGITFSTVIILLILFSGLMYYAEHGVQPKVFSSIPAAMWWGVVTLTTVGYGDIYPITVIGKILSSIVAMMGIGIFALPAGIIAAGFVEETQKRHKKEKSTCPHCGKEIEKGTH